VVLSVSLDSDEQKWKEFISKIGMTWLHYRDVGFAGSIANLFGVKDIPHTFTIDADGVLQDEHIGDVSIEGKLKNELRSPRNSRRRRSHSSSRYSPATTSRLRETGRSRANREVIVIGDTRKPLE